MLALATCAAWGVVNASAGVAAAETTAVDLGGAEISGSVTDTANPAVLAPGVWSDTLGATGSGSDRHYFRYERRMADSTVHIGVVGAPATGSDGIGLDVSTGDTDCGSNSASASYGFPQLVVGTSLAVGGEDRDDPCLSNPTLAIEVNRGSSSADADLPIALKIVEEAPVTGTDDLPEPPEDDSYRAVTSDASPADTPGATTFDDAPELDATADGTKVATTLAEGETQLWRVPVGWGQQVSTVADLPAYDDGDPDLTFYGPDVQLRVISPMRAVTDATTEDGSASATYGEEPAQATVGTAPVTYLNRFEYSGGPAAPGEFWVQVAVAPQDDSAEGEPIEVPVELTVAVTGSEDGVPTYSPNVLGPDGNDPPSGYEPQTPFLIDAETFSATAADGAVLPADADDADGWWGPKRYAGIGLALIGGVCFAAGALRLRRR